MPTTRNTRTDLESMRLNILKNILREYNLPTNGKKSVLIQRIMKRLRELNIINDSTSGLPKSEDYDRWSAEWEHLIQKGAKKQDKEFEKVINSFTKWCKINKFELFKITHSGIGFINVHINEIRAAFMDYNPADSIPRTKIEIFIEMFYENFAGIYEFFDVSNDNRDFGDNCPYNYEWFAKGLIEIHN